MRPLHHPRGPTHPDLTTGAARGQKPASWTSQRGRIRDGRPAGRQGGRAHLLVHGLALGLHVGVGIEVVGLEDLELVGELHPAIAAAAAPAPHRGGAAHGEHPRVARGPRP